MTHTIDIIQEARRVLEVEAAGIRECSERLGSSFEKAVHLLNQVLSQGGKILVSGVGKSGKVAEKMAATFSSTGSPSVFLHPTDALHGDLGILQNRDVCLMISSTGKTEELLRLADVLKTREVCLIGIGGDAKSPLARLCEAWIGAEVQKEACPHDLAPTTSTTVTMALGDALAIVLMQLRGFSAAHFGEFHPGGTLGKRLNLQVRDLMHPPCTVSPASSVTEIIELATQTKLGAVAVVEENRLVGVITDGDIRRALRLRERFFDLQAKDFMSAHPVCVGPEDLASQALILMENRNSQISVLCVIDSQKKCLGLLRLHDLLQNL